MLDNLLILELASVLAGPSVGQFLAELGATVVKVENVRTRGDVTRRWTLPEEPDDVAISAYFACCNAGKQSAALDLKTTAGRRLLHGLARQSDVVLASYRSGAAERLDADAATLRDLNPRLVYAHLTGYGPDDPRPGYDAVIQAESGFMTMNGSAGGPPTKMPVALMDVLAAHQLKQAVLLALLRRERTGEGATVAVSLLQAAVSALANQATAWLQAGVVPQRMGSAHPTIAPYGTVYHDADDRPLVLAVGTDRQFTALCHVLEIDALPDDSRFTTNADRVRHRDALTDRLRTAVAAWQRDALLARLHQAHVPAGAVNDVSEVFQQPAAAAMVLRHAAAHLQATGLRQRAFYFEDESPSRITPPPLYGEHTRMVLRERVGVHPTELDELVDAGIVFAAGP